jgi:4-oxalocrotonate tautomerase
MPLLTVFLSGQPDPVRSAMVAEALTELTKQHLGKDPAVTAVAIHHVDPAHWFVGGKALSSQDAASFWLDIKVTSGTNTKAQMAGYLDAVFKAMVTMLGPVHEDSYIMVHEVPAPAWGYSGKSQEYRFIAGTPKDAA